MGYRGRMIVVEAMTMMWNWDGASWWWWLLMSGGMLAFWGFVAWVVVQALRAGSRDAGPPVADPEATLAQRFALGEIDADEYQTRLDVLRGRRAA